MKTHAQSPRLKTYVPFSKDRCRKIGLLSRKPSHLSLHVTRNLLRMTAPIYTCSIEGEPLQRYRHGGYHPIRIGDTLNHGRYEILRKLGWGGYSTVWAARDLRTKKLVAVKITVAEREHDAREQRVTQALAFRKCPDHPGSGNLLSMIDHFQIQGPNGNHNCMVTQVMGPSVSEVLERNYRDMRLPGKLAKVIAKQALLGLDCLHQRGMAHGDLHIRNLAFVASNKGKMSEEDYLQRMKEPETGSVIRKDGRPLEPGIPDYLVETDFFPVNFTSDPIHVKMIDFGESFLNSEPPRELHTPLVVRAPEAIFKDKLDLRVDLWSMGCMIFELVTGQPPFDSIMVTPKSLVEQILDLTGEDLPERWQPAWRHISKGQAPEEPGSRLQEWLDEVYFDNECTPDFTREEITGVGNLIGRMLRLEPTERASARQVLEDPWFGQE